MFNIIKKHKLRKINMKFCTIIIIILVIIYINCEIQKNNNNNGKIIRAAYHSGSWYQSDEKLLSDEINQYLSKSDKISKNGILKSIIVPHAGYRFSGLTAAKSFININPSDFNRVVILGPSHHEYFTGCGLTSFESFSTPFGNIDVDINYTNKLSKIRGLFFRLSESVDLNEHSIEMELPFLKFIFKNKNIKIIPIVVGDNDLKTNIEIGKTLYELYSDPKTLFVISSDFCHWGKNFGFTYHDKKFKNIWESIQDLDKQALDIISEINSEKLDEYFKRTKNTICGRNPISIAVSVAENYKKHHKDKKVTFDNVGYAQSNKVNSPYESSVSYAAVINYIS